MKKIIMTALFAATTIFADASIAPARITKRVPIDQRTLLTAVRANGNVKLQLNLDDRGRLQNIEILEGRPDLLAAAIYTVRQWDFAAATVDGHPVRSRMNVDLKFEFNR